MKNLLFGTMLLVAACNGADNTNVTYESMSTAAPAKMEMAADMPSEAYDVKRIDLQCLVDDLPTAEKWVRGQVTAVGGKVTAQSNFNEGKLRSTHYQLQLPAKELDSWMKLLENQSAWQLQGKQLSISSIQQQYVDHAQRLQTRQALEKRYLELLAQAKNMTDVLAIEEKLVNMRSEIEWMQSEQGRMDTQLQFVEVSLRLEERFTAWGRISSKAGEQWKQGWQVLASLVLGLIRLWPLVILAALGTWLYRRRKARKQTA